METIRSATLQKETDINESFISFQLQDSNSEPDVDLENQYYNSKALKEDDPKAALESFQVSNTYTKKTIYNF